MNARFLPSSARKGATAAAGPPADAAPASAGLADHACCCASKAAVRVTMPPATGRPNATELLLCGHHFRLSRRALDTARAVVANLPGTSPDIAAWIDRIRLAAFAEG